MIELWEHQEDAIDAWESEGRNGILQMATGTGKTYTAIGALDSLLDNHPDPLAVVVAVPYTHLAAQWTQSMADWGYEDTTQLYGSKTPEWGTKLSRLLSDLEIGIRDSELIITTHRTMAAEDFRTLLSDADMDTLIIADEVHGLGSEYQRQGLLDAYDYRLGLSATPQRYFDEEGTTFLLDYFGGVVFKYSLEDAIPEFLVPYTYHPVIVEMTPDELESYRQISTRLAALFGQLEDQEETAELEDEIQSLQIKRARIIKAAENKYHALNDVLDELDVDHLLVYTNHQQIDRVQSILNDRGIRQHKFTAKEDADLRGTLLEQFDDGTLDALVAMKCLDEGVDVPSTKQAIMMSNSMNRMQFVQRRGRVLRRAPGKEEAALYDFVVVPTLDPDRTLVQSERNILEKELRRFEEFASLAKNEAAARNTLQPVRTTYEL